MNIIIWYRRDLRVHDHAALWHACQEATQVIPLFVLDPTHFANREVGSGRVQFLLDALADLDQSLCQRGSRLTLLRGKAEEVLPRFVRAIGADAVYYLTDIERWSGQVRDQTLTQTAAAEGWTFRPFLNYPFSITMCRPAVPMRGRYGRRRGPCTAKNHSIQRPIRSQPSSLPFPLIYNTFPPFPRWRTETRANLTCQAYF